MEKIINKKHKSEKKQQKIDSSGYIYIFVHA